MTIAVACPPLGLSAIQGLVSCLFANFLCIVDPVLSNHCIELTLFAYITGIEILTKVSEATERKQTHELRQT